MTVTILIVIAVVAFTLAVLFSISASILDDGEDGFITGALITSLIVVSCLVGSVILYVGHHSNTFNNECKKLNGTAIGSDCYKNPLIKVRVVYK